MKYFNAPDIFAIDLFDGENFRHTLVTLMGQVIGKLRMAATSDNVVTTMLAIEVCGSFGAVSTHEDTNPCLLCAQILDYTLFSYKAIHAPKGLTASIYRTLVKEKSTLPIVQYYCIIAYQLVCIE